MSEHSETPTSPGQPETPAGPPAPVTIRAPADSDLRLAEAMVFSAASPVPTRALARILPDDVDPEAVVAALRARYAGRGVELVDAGGGLMFRTAPDLAPALRKVISVPRRLTRVAMETLAIIAYHQPATRADVEHLRGTSLSQQTLDSLLEARLIAPAGRKDAPGRPTLWVTTAEFLTAFGLPDIRSLPRREDLFVEPPRPAPGQAASGDTANGPEDPVGAGGEPDDDSDPVPPAPASC